ncbi:MAG: hypothetical protein JW910_05235, partial [Anaerolineae bacterium]|nr:hypothetical protein [Anaerolineae bacterium]
ELKRTGTDDAPVGGPTMQGGVQAQASSDKTGGSGGGQNTRTGPTPVTPQQQASSGGAGTPSRGSTPPPAGKSATPKQGGQQAPSGQAQPGQTGKVVKLPVQAQPIIPANAQIVPHTGALPNGVTQQGSRYVYNGRQVVPVQVRGSSKPEDSFWVYADNGQPARKISPARYDAGNKFSLKQGATSLSGKLRANRPPLPTGASADRLPTDKMLMRVEPYRDPAAAKRLNTLVQEADKATTLKERKKLGDEMADKTAEDLTHGEGREALGASAAETGLGKGRRPDVGQVEVTLEGRSASGFSTSKLDQFWIDFMRSPHRVYVEVASLHKNSLDQLRRLAAQAQEALRNDPQRGEASARQVNIMITIRQDTPANQQLKQDFDQGNL